LVAHILVLEARSNRVDAVAGTRSSFGSRTAGGVTRTPPPGEAVVEAAADGVA
jgi:hypothetical protein